MHATVYKKFNTIWSSRRVEWFVVKSVIPFYHLLLLLGYQRELGYQRRDGYFSAFGQSDSSGSMWLTAFVAKSFQKARAFIYVDETTMLRAVEWMIKRQNIDGSFPEPGRLLNKALMVGFAQRYLGLTSVDQLHC